MKSFSILLVAMAATLIISCNSQNGGGNYHYKKVYKQSITYGDYFTATNAIYNLWIDDTANAASYKDTLANLYYLRGQYLQSAAFCKDLLTKHPGDLKLEELLAADDQTINNLTEALNLYQSIYGSTHGLFYLYEVASLQFELGRVDECNQTLNAIIADTGSVHQKFMITVGQGQQQPVPYKAAALNIRGVIEKGLKHNDAAKQAFHDALDVDPQFVLPKGNLTDMSKASTGSAAPTTK